MFKSILNRVRQTVVIGLVSVSASHVFAAIIPAPPQLAASSYILMDANSGKIIVANNEHQQLPPASLTKLLTSYIVEEEIQDGRLALTDSAHISKKAWGWGGSKMFVKVDDDVSIEDLLRGLIIQSGNDAAISLAEHIAGSEEVFADVMNQTAEKLGMKDSHFVNSSGWPAKGHLSSAYDMAILAKAIIDDHPEFYPIYAEKDFTYAGIKQSNRNTLLWRDPSVDGLKTGHTESAGYCLVSSAKQDDMRLIAVVMGTKSDDAREQESMKLLTYGFRYYETHELYKADTALNTSRIWAGSQDTIDLGLDADAIVTIPRDSQSKLDASLQINPVIEAPVRKGDILGSLVVKMDDEVVYEKPLVALQDVEQAGFFSRIFDYIALFFHNLFN
ncbi:D-alanyl-D-alanine carboxypeptidase family protein [Gynuella sunshinyii]|uniref:serine-type D-Ala-D-Ala carboxypeptidase n=1 Tax=Gynuella sunshinyii YC6258 TaxID=1445510 RepID=A0A0C5VIL9_9GAMM|nr:D-alanyl-D-alanine carboxypeptidase family protein [Gynuella sunshinyii]AJQ94517.1 D-alanyl-D-alanine carboxypeptidase [Gynuella sunshinyii YC6258]